MQSTHWLGAGLSTLPGIRRLADTNNPLTVWNRHLERAQEGIRGSVGVANGTAQAKVFDWDAIAAAVQAGDVVVSMLPGDLHARVAQLCLDNRAHFVSSSYLAADIQAMHASVVDANLVFVNEVGLDPGIDHLFAHLLVEDYRRSPACKNSNKLSFRSYCGGVPAVANKFRYKFSWSPFGVLKALTSPAKWIENSDVQQIETPWKAVSDYRIPGVSGKKAVFEAYPNRDSLPFMNAYHFDDSWQVEQFVRGTLRLSGWASAWQQLFDEIEQLQQQDEQSARARLTEISDELWQQHAYEAGEADRVILAVELEVHDDEGTCVWHQSRTIDNIGNDSGSAMARLVSHTVSLAVDSVHAGELQPGVQAAPSDIALVQRWLDVLTSLNDGFEHKALV